MTEMNTYPEFPKGCRTLPEMLEHTAATWPDRIAYQWFDRATEAWASITWKEFLSAVRRWQKALKASGLKKGDRVAVLLTNSIESLLIDQSVLGLRHDSCADARDRYAVCLRFCPLGQRRAGSRHGV